MGPIRPGMLAGLFITVVQEMMCSTLNNRNVFVKDFKMGQS